MTLFGSLSFRWILAAVILSAVSACASAPYRYEPLSETTIVDRAVSQESGVFRVRASVPGAEETERLFGAPLYDRGIQPVWLEITNSSPARARLILSSVDREYFSPLEVAYIHRKRFSKQGWLDMERHVYANSLHRQIAPGGTVSGFVFTNATNGTKAFQVDLVTVDQESDIEQFVFFVDVPGFVPDHAKVDFQGLYLPEEISDVDNEGLRALVSEFPCCSTNHDGSKEGRPLNLFFVAGGRNLLHALLRSGWDETSYRRDDSYLNAADYVFGRPPDAIFRKARGRTTERNEMALWLAPVRVDGEPLWVVQMKHNIGRRYEVGDQLLGVRLDPDADEGPNYTLQDLWYSQTLRHYAFSRSGKFVPRNEPVTDFGGNPWFATGYRLVLWLSGDPIPLSEASAIEWDEVVKRSELRP